MEESLDASDAVIEALRSRGWCFRDLEQIQVVIMISCALADDPRMVVDLVESELLNMDLRSFGGSSLPDSHLLRKSSYIQGPKVLQLSSVKDISQSSLNGISRNSSGQRLLRLGLTDGHGEITAVEYSHIPSIPDDIVPGTKVRLEYKAPIHSDIVCLNPKVFNILGGVVQPLYEEWQMNRKYSGVSRLSGRLTQGGDAGGPPPFEKLQIGDLSRQHVNQGIFSQHVKQDFRDPTSKSSIPKTVVSENAERPQSSNLKEATDMSKAPLKETTREKPSSSETRPREVAEAVPVQNQAAAQKLLQKMSQQNGDNRHSRGRKYRGKGKIEDPVVFTLEEYEKGKAGAEKFVNDEYLDLSHDEALAWKLQNQFDLEDSHVPRSGKKAEAENLRMSMFSYERDEDKMHRMGNGGRGRGKGRGKGRSRGRYG